MFVITGSAYLHALSSNLYPRLKYTSMNLWTAYNVLEIMLQLEKQADWNVFIAIALEDGLTQIIILIVPFAGFIARYYHRDLYS